MSVVASLDQDDGWEGQRVGTRQQQQKPQLALGITINIYSVAKAFVN